jgi:hypothetical protein
LGFKSASIWPKDGNWFGEFMLAGKPEFFRQAEHEKMLSHLRITLAGRRGELLFEPHFCVRAGLDELVYAQIVIMPAIVGRRLDPAIHYSDVWGTTLVEVDETLLKYEFVVAVNGGLPGCETRCRWRGEMRECGARRSRPTCRCGGGRARSASSR